MKRFLLLLLSASLLGGVLTADDLSEALEQERESQTATAISIIFDSSGSKAKNQKLKQA